MKNELNVDVPKPGQFFTSDCHKAVSCLNNQTLHLDKIAKLPFSLEDKDFRATLEQTFDTDVASIVTEGSRGLHARQLLAVEIANARITLKKLQSIQTGELNSYLSNHGSENRVRLLEFLTDRVFRRLIASLDLLHRLDPSTPSIRFSAVGTDNRNED